MAFKNTLPSFRNSALSRRLQGAKLDAENLGRLLMSLAHRGSLNVARFMEDKVVCAVTIMTGRGLKVFRGYGKSIAEAFRYVAFELYCRDGSCV